MNEIRAVRHLRGHLLYVEFDNGMAGEIDLSAYPRKGPIFAPLADIDYFRMVRIDGGTLAWPNGADIAPERLYELVAKAPREAPKPVAC